MVGFKGEDFNSGAIHENSADYAADWKHEKSEKLFSAIHFTVISASASFKKKLVSNWLKSILFN